MRNPVIFWFNNPPKVGKGAFNYLARKWDGKVIYVFLNDFRAERKQTKWDDGDFGGAEIIKLYESPIEETISSIFELHPGAVHIINGFNSPISKAILPYLKKECSRKAIFMSERPDLMGNRVERALRGMYYHIKYQLILSRIKSVMAGVLALGKMGVDIYASYGWDKKLLYPFMYCPPLLQLDVKEKEYSQNRMLKFLYVGRFYYKTKGVDILLKAALRLNGNFKIDFVGGYGKNAQQTINLINRSDKMNYLGSWPSSEVGRRMQDYDAVVIPTKYDGWNLLVNEAVNAGIPIIVTDGAVSDEVVSKFGCGIVVPHSNIEALAEAMQSTIDNPQILVMYAHKTQEAKEYINENVVGQYLIDILNSIEYYECPRPECPWL